MWNVTEGQGRRRWEAAGRPIVPSVVVDGTLVPILHVSQLAAAIGVGHDAVVDPTPLAWDIVSLLDAWCEHLPALSFEELIEPTASRGRSLRNLTVNAFHPIELLPAAWTSGRFDWDPDGDDEREARLEDADAVIGYARPIAASWTAFVLEVEDRLAEEDPAIASPRGEVTYSTLLASQRWHAAFHYRQLVEHLAPRGKALSGTLRVEALAGLDLPIEIW
jgi:hypothetical protein